VILAKGTIRTMERSQPVVEHLVVDGDVVGDQGSRAGERIDLRGRSVIPGLTDSHTHFPTWASLRRWLDLEDCATLEEILGRVSHAADEGDDERWLVGYGWANDPWDSTRARPRDVLDKVTGNVPTALWSKDMHTYWLNSAGVARAALDRPKNADAIEVDRRGEATGILREAAAWRFRERELAVSLEDYADAVVDGIRVAHARGVTAVHDKDGWISAPEIWEKVRRRGELTLRVWQSVPPERMADYEEIRDEGRAGDFLRVGYVKVFVDGSLGSGTALMLDGRPGITTTSADELDAIIRTASATGWPVAVHAIGDAANRIALDVFEATRPTWHPLGLRQRVEHAQHLHHDDLPRFANLGIACSVQFADAVLSRDTVDGLSSELAEGSFAFRSLWNSGARVVNGSDAPLTQLDPLLGIRAGVVRTLDERPPWRTEQALTVTQTLEASTVLPAWLCGEEGVRGRLVPGQLADLVVLDRDPFACTAEELAEMEVVATMVGGEWVHNPPPWD